MLHQRLHSIVLAASLLSGGLLATACSTTPSTKSERSALGTSTQAFVTTAKETDPSLKKFFDSCAGYAAIPSIAKGGFILGGAYGKGQVFAKGGSLLGYCDVSQASIGAQIGGQSFGEIVFFETDDALAQFKGGKWAVAAQASAVALKAGAGAAAKYQNGVAIFIMNPEGLMLEASIGGQQFGYTDAGDVD